MCTIILDFDGTIADTREVIVKTLHQTIDATAHRQPSDEQCIATIGMPLDEALAKLTDTDKAHGIRYADIYRKLFNENNYPDAVPMFPHVADTIKLLYEQGNSITIASSRVHSSLEHFVRRFGLDRYICLILGADDVARAKPHPEAVLATMQKLNAKPETTLVVGDTEYDIMMGQRAGAHTCGVTYGNGTRQQLEICGAQHIVDDFAHITEIIKDIKQKK